MLYPFTSLEFDMRSISSLRTWSIACWLALCTRFCLVFMTIDVYSEETTLTAILGNLELSTSVAIGVLFFWRDICKSPHSWHFVHTLSCGCDRFWESTPSASR